MRKLVSFIVLMICMTHAALDPQEKQNAIEALSGLKVLQIEEYSFGGLTSIKSSIQTLLGQSDENQFSLFLFERLHHVQRGLISHNQYTKDRLDEIVNTMGNRVDLRQKMAELERFCGFRKNSMPTEAQNILAGLMSIRCDPLSCGTPNTDYFFEHYMFEVNPAVIDAHVNEIKSKIREISSMFETLIKQQTVELDSYAEELRRLKNL